MFGLDTATLIIILIVILVIFVGSQLPRLARKIGTSDKELKEGLREDPIEKKIDETIQNAEKKSKR